MTKISNSAQGRKYLKHMELQFPFPGFDLSQLAWLNNGIDTSAGKYIITENGEISAKERIIILWKSWCLTSLAFWICRDSASNIQCDISVIKDHQHSKPPPGKDVEFCDLNSTRGYLSLHCEEWCHLNGESWPMYLTLWISLSKTTIKLTTDKRRPHAS